MAPLKPDSYRYGTLNCSLYPWLKGHGSFEARLARFVARGNLMYPWLKGHGSFEARLARFVARGNLMYPWLKGHGSFEAAYRTARLASSSGYPWLKGHGSIEAVRCRSGFRSIASLYCSIAFLTSLIAWYATPQL